MTNKLGLNKLYDFTKGVHCRPTDGVSHHKNKIPSDPNNPSKKQNWDAHFNETKNLINSWSRK